MSEIVSSEIIAGVVRKHSFDYFILPDSFFIPAEQPGAARASLSKASRSTP
jgi:hypothetical protein